MGEAKRRRQHRDQIIAVQIDVPLAMTDVPNTQRLYKREGSSTDLLVNTNAAATEYGSSDKAWFKQHPDRNYRARLPYPGELAELKLAFDGFVLVHQIRSGLRQRIAIAFPRMLPVPGTWRDGQLVTIPEGEDVAAWAARMSEVARPPASEIYQMDEKTCQELYERNRPADAPSDEEMICIQDSLPPWEQAGATFTPIYKK